MENSNMAMVAKKAHKETFERISPEKRDRIITIATKEFAKNGFKGANINIIAKKAGISIGSMYNYFESKEDLLLTVINEAYKLLEKVLGSVSLENKNFYEKIEELVCAAQKFARQYPEIHQVYLDITSEGLSHLTPRLSRTIEYITIEFYRHELEQAKIQGIVREDIDVNVASLCIDNILVLTQFSYTSEYFKERLKLFIGEDALDDDKRIVKGVVDFIKNALMPRMNISNNK